MPERTFVKNTLRMRRNPDATPSERLELLGEALELISVTLDGSPHAAHRAHEHGLVVEGVPDEFELTICWRLEGHPTKLGTWSGLACPIVGADLVGSEAH